MPKVKQIDFTVDGENYSFSVNVNKDGIFKIVLGWEICEKIGLTETVVTGKDLKAIESKIYSAVNEYNNAQKSYRLLIEISYEASGYYSLENYHNAKFLATGFADDTDKIGFDYRVIIEESAPGRKTLYYESRKIHNLTSEYTDKRKVIDEFIIGKQIYSAINPTSIPYSREAIETLEKARSAIRGISEILLNVLSQSPEEIEQSLISNNLLGN